MQSLVTRRRRLSIARAALLPALLLASVAACVGADVVDSGGDAGGRQDIGGSDDAGLGDDASGGADMRADAADTGGIDAPDAFIDEGCVTVTCDPGFECKDGDCVPETVTGCTDSDGDGFGDGCPGGADCDDGESSANPMAAELCDSIDNDCDGETDEGDVCAEECPPTACLVGAVRCGSDAQPEACTADAQGCGRWTAGESCGPGSACDRGSCVDVGDACRDADHDGRGEGCTLGPDCDDARPAVYGDAVERCDTLDNDCDGATDEDFAGLGSGCSLGRGACERSGTIVCSGDGASASCNATPAAPAPAELCGNALDDDCDGTADEGFDAFGTECGEGTGTCTVRGTYICTADGSALQCSIESGSPDAELCGTGADEDCDGATDEGFENEGNPCTVGVGACRRDGTWVCAPDLRSLACSATEGSPNAMDLCGNAIDDDCDGETDEGWTALGERCVQGTGACQRTGAMECTEDRTSSRCSAVAGDPESETCNGVDDDCDDQIDDGGVCDTCDDDAFEENDDRLSATPPESGGADRRIAGAICRADRDWVRLGTIANGQQATVNLLFAHADGDVDIALYADSEYVTSSTSSDDNEQIVWTADRGATLYVDIYHYYGDSRVPYSLSWTISAATGCDEDIWEDNDRSTAATSLARGESLDAQLCPDDSDWFYLGAPSGGEPVELNLVFTHGSGEGDVDVELFQDVPGDGTTVPAWVAGAYSSTDNEQIRYTSAGGSLFARVYSGRAGASAPYRISQPVPNACSSSEDAWEENDQSTEAAALRRATLVSTWLCGGEEDWYALGRLSAGTVVDVDLTFTHAEGDVDVELIRLGTGLVVGASYGISSAEAIDLTIGESDSYVLRVYRLSSVGGQAVNVRFDAR